MSIECYDEKEFHTKHKSMYLKVLKESSMAGVDLSKYYFGQYHKDGDIEEVTYNNRYDENMCFNIQWYKGKMDALLVAID